MNKTEWSVQMKSRHDGGWLDGTSIFYSREQADSLLLTYYRMGHEARILTREVPGWTVAFPTQAEPDRVQTRARQWPWKRATDG